MAEYTAREWSGGDIVTAVDLNRMEQGIEDSRGILVVNSVYDSENDSYTLDKTWQEIYDAFPFAIEYCHGKEGKFIINSVGIKNNFYWVEGFDSYNTVSASGYPTTSIKSSGGTLPK